MIKDNNKEGELHSMGSRKKMRVNIINVIKLLFLLALIILFIYRIIDAIENKSSIQKFYEKSGDGKFFLYAPYILIVIEVIAVFQKCQAAVIMSLIDIMMGIVIILYECMVLFAKMINVGDTHNIGAKPIASFILCVIGVMVIGFKLAVVKIEKNKKLKKNNNIKKMNTKIHS